MSMSLNFSFIPHLRSIWLIKNLISYDFQIVHNFRLDICSLFTARFQEKRFYFSFSSCVQHMPMMRMKEPVIWLHLKNINATIYIYTQNMTPLSLTLHQHHFCSLCWGISHTLESSRLYIPLNFLSNMFWVAQPQIH